jgi:hypothetical protein
MRGKTDAPAHGRRAWDRFVVRGAPVIMALALVMMLVAGVLSITALRGLNRIDAAERNTCVRIQNLRAEVNAQGRIIFITLDTIRQGTQAQKNPRTLAYGALADLVSYQPPTDCKAAVDDPTGYQRPDPIPFTKLTPRPALPAP